MKQKKSPKNKKDKVIPSKILEEKPTESSPSTFYHISIFVNGVTLEGSGSTVLDALRKIQAPLKITTKGQLRMTDGQKKVEMTLLPIRIKRLFYPNSQPIIAKQLLFLMK